MTSPSGIKQISNIAGIHEYIFVNPEGKIIFNNITNPKNTARMVSLCAKHARAIGKANFKYMIFSRKSSKDFLIFPVGNSYLGVIKYTEMKTQKLADDVLNFIGSLPF